MPGPFIYPQEIFDTSTLNAGIVAALPPFVNPGAIPACYAPLVAAIATAVGIVLPVGCESSGPVVIISGVGVGVKGAWYQMIAAAAAKVVQFVLVFNPGASASTGSFDIGLGAAGFEVAKYKDVGLLISPGILGLSFPCSVPIGSRISIRVADSIGVQNYTFILSCLE